MNNRFRGFIEGVNRITQDAKRKLQGKECDTQQEQTPARGNRGGRFRSVASLSLPLHEETAPGLLLLSTTALLAAIHFSMSAFEWNDNTTPPS